MSEVPSRIQACRKYRINFGIFVIFIFVREIYSASGLQLSILISGGRATSSDVGSTIMYSGLSSVQKRFWNFGDISFPFGDIFNFRFTVSHFDFRKSDDVERWRNNQCVLERVVGEEIKHWDFGDICFRVGNMF
jgi:hypothetical protein